MSELSKRIQKIGQPPGTPIYTGKEKNTIARITVTNYSAHDFHEASGATLEQVLPAKKEPGVIWVHVEGLNNAALIDQLAKYYDLHPLTVEDILNVEQRSKVEEFEGYIFVTLKMLQWNTKNRSFSTEQFSLAFGQDFVLSFQESNTPVFNDIRERLRSNPNQRLRQHGADYLAYRLIDTIVDQYFVVLEGLGDQVEKMEDVIITTPTPHNARLLYRLKRQIFTLRKAIWPIREAISHLLHVEEELITSFTRLYLRDVYDHTVQAIDTLEAFRDMISGMLDMYLTGLTNRMNEIMKVLTIIATIFIPITFIASIYGMNFEYMPELHYYWGYPITLGVMFLVVLLMLYYFRRKKWL